MTMTRTLATQFIKKCIGADVTADYMLAGRGKYLGLYSDGTVWIGAYVGHEVDPDDRPIARVKTFDRVDVDDYRDDGDCDQPLDDREYLIKCLGDQVWANNEIDVLVFNLVEDAVNGIR